VSTGEEAAEAQAEHVVRCEALHHLAVLHHAQLWKDAHCLEVHTHCPQDLGAAAAQHRHTTGTTASIIVLTGPQQCT
jgi:hypothetical protein